MASERDRFNVRDLMPAASLLSIGLAGLLIGSLTNAESSDRYLVVAAPGSSFLDTSDIISIAEGGILDAGGFQNVAIAASSRVDFADRARAAGAWLVLPSPVLAGCVGDRKKAPPQ